MLIGACPGGSGYVGLVAPPLPLLLLPPPSMVGETAGLCGGGPNKFPAAPTNLVTCPTESITTWSKLTADPNLSSAKPAPEPICAVVENARKR